MNKHTIQSGESLWSLSKKYNISVNQILKVNPDIKDPDKISIGQQINIPTNNSKPLKTANTSSNINLTEDTWRGELAEFRSAFEGYREHAYEDTYKSKKNPIWTIGTGLTYWIDDKGNEIPVKKGDKITKEENHTQLMRRIKYNERIIKTYLPNFDKYPAALKFQLSDAMFNVGPDGVWKKSPNYVAALKRYEESEGWKNKNYPLIDIYQHADWNWSDKKSLGVRTRMRANPDAINTNDYKIVLDPTKYDSLQTVYQRKLDLMNPRQNT